MLFQNNGNTDGGFRYSPLLEECQVLLDVIDFKVEFSLSLSLWHFIFQGLNEVLIYSMKLLILLLLKYNISSRCIPEVILIPNYLKEKSQTKTWRKSIKIMFRFIFHTVKTHVAEQKQGSNYIYFSMSVANTEFWKL